nr:NYN domain-containing protein [Ferrovum sp.]
MKPKFAVLVDGGFIAKVLKSKLNRLATADDVVAECDRIVSHPDFVDHDLLRIYFYDAPPASGVYQNPLDKSQTNLGTSKIHSHYSRLLDTLELKPNFALRLGETMVRGWKMGDAAFKDMTENQRPVVAKDLVPNIEQKGVDLRIGLDIARLSLKDLVSAIVIITGDSDLVPAFKFARREGVRIYLDHLSSNVRRELTAHADIIL